MALSLQAIRSAASRAIQPGVVDAGARRRVRANVNGNAENAPTQIVINEERRTKLPGAIAPSNTGTSSQFPEPTEVRSALDRIRANPQRALQVASAGGDQERMTALVGRVAEDQQNQRSGNYQSFRGPEQAR